jgi:lactam utilization protein B
VAIQSSRSDACLFGNVVEAGIRAGPGKRLLRHLQNALAVPLRVGARFSWGHFLILGRHKNKLQPETVSGYHMY